MIMNVETLPIEDIRTDLVVVGAGGAACRAAVSARAAGADVHLIAKAPMKTGGSTVHGASEIMSMGAAAGFGDRRDQPEIHFQDTMRAGRGFIDESLVRVLAEDAPKRIKDLIALGVPFDQQEDGNYRLIRSDFGTYGRAMGAKGKTGLAFVEALGKEMQRLGVVIDAPVMLLDIVRDRNGELCGVLAYDSERHRLLHYRAPAVVIGAGGMHGMFGQQVSTREMTGDGQAICFRHGAELINLEFHQFGPAMIHPYVQLFSKNIFVLHPKITNTEGEEFLPNYLPEGVTVDEVLDEKVFPFTISNPSRYLDIAMAREINEGRGTPRGAVNFSFAHVPDEELRRTSPNTYRWMAERGVSMREDMHEVGIAFQCMNGGVRMIGPDAASTIPGVYVVGETAGGIRGPDRPGGNSLAEGQVFGHRAGEADAARAAASKHAAEAATFDESIDLIEASLNRQGGADLDAIASAIRDDMQRHCLVEKSEEGLQKALGTVLAGRREIEAGFAATPETLVEALSIRNLAQCAELVLRACLNRTESRSAHYRVDHPGEDDRHWLRSVLVQRVGDGVALSDFHYEPQEQQKAG